VDFRPIRTEDLEVASARNGLGSESSQGFGCLTHRYRVANLEKGTQRMTRVVRVTGITGKAVGTKDGRCI